MTATENRTSSIDDDFNPYLDLPITKLKALYDYSYRDDDGHVVNMRKGEEYHLLQKQGDWWEVIRDAGDTNELSFYVPANYVEIVGRGLKGPEPPPKRTSTGSHQGNESGSESLNNSITKDVVFNLDTGLDTDNVNTGETISDSTVSKMEPFYVNSDDTGVINFERKNSTSTFTSFSSKTLPSNSGISTKPECVRRSFSEDGEYVNLDRYRNEAGLTSERTDGSRGEDSDLYANASQLNNQKDERTQASQNRDDRDLLTGDTPGTYMRTLLDVWDMYLDKDSNRIYYINRETHERTFKPPRHPNKAEQFKHLEQKPVAVPSVTEQRKRSAPQLKFPHELSSANIPDGYVVEETDGRTLYINPNTNERWCSNVNTDGEKYYYKIGTEETVWDLPKIVMSPDSPPPPITRERSPQGSPSVARSVKARSMIIGNKIRMETPAYLPAALPKSSTLPLLSTPALMEETDTDKRSTQLSAAPVDSLDGTLNKAKIIEGGKAKKKNWSQSYVKLSGTNLVFYKNQMAAKSQQNSPHGRPEFIVPLIGAHADKHTKDKSSRKNVITLKTSQGDEYLLHHDDEPTILKWLAHLEVAINGLGTVSGLEPPVFEETSISKDKRKNSFKLFHGRNNSGSEADGMERRKRGLIKDKLLNFVSRRPTKESLEQKGIIKDAVFGAHLKVLCDKEKGKIPKFVVKCVTAIEKRGLDHDGLYRISGNLAQIQKLRCQVDQDSYNLDEDRWDVHVLTGSLKLFFRELKEPLYTFLMFDRFVPALSKEKNSDRLKAVKELISTLPKYNYETMKFLFAHLLKVIDMSKENRMQVHNVAIVFGPTLIWPEKESPNMAANMVYQSRIVEYCLLEYKNIFR
ncbi:hypothetical protein FSP39_000688 [Pinctada imbricata]|uniref:Rho GTPase-activating protein 12-like protein n=1 Tax=Pinctada imbricata TaxID=66713 RepID=A0AA88YUM6_PINIB|nr:hypothetical protein FSP39_000688 [Pinctada imbricata]